ncbi:MAG: AMP-binding protein, partial [Pseudoalteromonas sp.]|uniref:condensation domain-containing protein n=1 Tax=Pseudoalteromonas sp. TaxID=53249 RepID=UPI001D3E4BA7
MDLKSILDDCVRLGIKISVQNDKLKVDAPKGSLDNEFLSIIKNNKNKLIKFLDKYKDINEIERVYPNIDEGALSYGQSQMWFLDSAFENNNNYHFYRIVNLKGDIDIQLLEKALASIVSRHSILRTCYHQADGKVIQSIQGDTEFSLRYINLSLKVGSDKELSINNVKKEFKSSTFDLSKGFMVQALLLKTHQSRFQLHLKLHHVASDGWSIGIIIKEISEIYAALTSGQDTKMDFPLQYIDYAMWQQGANFRKRIIEGVSFFESYLANAPEIHNLTNGSRKRQGLSKARHIKSKFSHELTHTIKLFCKKNNVSIFSFLQFCLSIIISRYSNTKDVVIGTPMANRASKVLENVVGYFVNTVPIRTRLNSKKLFLTELVTHHTTIQEVSEKQYVPLNEIVKQVVTSRVEGISPLIQIVFTLQNNETPTLYLGDVAFDIDDPLSDTTDLDLSIECVEEGEQFEIKWTFAEDLFSSNFINMLGIHFELLVKSALAQPQELICELGMMADNEVQHLVYDLNNTAMDYPKDKCIHELFEEQARDNPGNIAVVFEDKELTYKELNEKANQLAHYLREHHDIAPDTLVGICVERSLEMVIGILGILKSGGAYVPLDPSYPQARINYMLEDAAVDVVLSHGEVEGALDGFSGTRLKLDGLSEAGAQGESYFCSSYSKDNLSTAEVGLTSSALAYVIYTSGS